MHNSTAAGNGHIYNHPRRQFIRNTLAVTLSGSSPLQTQLSATVPPWKWTQLEPQGDHTTTRVPLARDPWNGILTYDNSLYLFGGAYPRYGTPTGPGDLTRLGVTNDLWKYDLTSHVWTPIELDNGENQFDSDSSRPCARVLPCWANVDNRFYLFGGLTVRGSGWKTQLLNDLWRYCPGKRKWNLLESDNRQELDQPTQVTGKRPTQLAAMGVTVIGTKIYLFSGWGGNADRVVLSPQLWCYDTRTLQWNLIGTGQNNQPWPSKRYCPAVTSWQGKLYLWGGRDTQDRSPQFYNDLWQFDPETDRWKQLADNQPGGTNEHASAPLARYAMGEAKIGGHWYLFGGFGNEKGNSPQLNDLWQMDLSRRTWSLLQPHNRAKDVSRNATRPAVRRVPAMVSSGQSVYLFGGLDLTSGTDERGPLIGFNDLWQGNTQ